MRSSVIAFIVCTFVPVSLSLRCYSGQQTSSANSLPFVEVNCPTSDFCFDNYVKRHHNGDNSYTITKSCGEPGKCFETGCEGPLDEKRCCCVGDLCNSSNPVVYTVFPAVLLARYLL